MNNNIIDKKKLKETFQLKLQKFSEEIINYISYKKSWTIKAFIDRYKNLYTISSDTKIISKILEIHLFPLFLKFAKENNYKIELATYQNWYPDLTFISKSDDSIKFAVDLKTTYRDDSDPLYCNGFTLGSHGEYFINRNSTKNIQYPYNQYIAHFCFGIIYSRVNLNKEEELKIYKIDDLQNINSVATDFVCFIQEKWKIASDKGESGNTANIGSIKNIDDLIHGRGMFSKFGEEIFDDYWANFGKLEVKNSKGAYKKLSSLKEYINYKSLNIENYVSQTKRIKNGK